MGEGSGSGSDFEFDALGAAIVANEVNGRMFVMG
jgi:hypothetical protein